MCITIKKKEKKKDTIAKFLKQYIAKIANKDKKNCVENSRQEQIILSTQIL